MSFIHLLESDEAPMTARNFYAGGDPGPLVKSMAHVPEMLQKAMPFIAVTLGPSAIDLETKEFVILRTSAQQRCNDCVGTHTGVAMNAGLSENLVRLLRGEASEHVLPARESALLKWCDTLAETAAEIPDALKAETPQHFDESEVLELTMLVGATAMLNRYATSLSLPIADAHQVFLAENGFSDGGR